MIVKEQDCVVSYRNKLFRNLYTSVSEHNVRRLVALCVGLIVSDILSRKMSLQKLVCLFCDGFAAESLPVNSFSAARMYCANYTTQLGPTIT